MTNSSIKYLPIVAIIVSLIYWIYLALSSHMVIIYDSVGYERLGRLITEQGWTEFFKTGPHREPLYPLLIACAIRLADIAHISYQSCIIAFQIIIFLITQLLMLALLRQLKLSTTWQTIALLYFGFSPALVNSMLSLYSEILTLPFVLGIILVAIKITCVIASEAKQSSREDCFVTSFLAMTLGLLFVIITLIKGIFEVIAPLFLMFILIIIFQQGKIRQAFKFFLTTFLIFYCLIFSYKTLNQTFNGQFTLTNRAAWAFYGNTARRMEPLNLKRVIVALAYMPGEGACRSIFPEGECNFWSFRRSDEHGFAKSQELASQGMTGRSQDRELLKLAKEMILKNPFQYGLFMMIESGKMFFWESTKIGFVEYPAWLTKLFDFVPFKNGLRLAAFFLTLFSIIYSISKAKNNTTLTVILIFITLYIGIHSFFFTLTRYSLPIAPLFIILIVYTLQNITQPKSAQRP